MTTSDPMSCCAITLTASSTEPFGGVVNRALPLIRRISLTSMVPSFGVTRRRCRRSPSVQITPGIAPRATSGMLPRQGSPLPHGLRERPAINVLQLTANRYSPSEPRYLEPACPEQLAALVRGRLAFDGEIRRQDD